MAYADKITNIRRMALIRPYPESNGAIVWEGANIEGECLLRRVDMHSPTITLIEEDRLAQFADEYELEIKYQDPETDEDWEPREDS